MRTNSYGDTIYTSQETFEMELAETRKILARIEPGLQALDDRCAHTWGSVETIKDIKVELQRLADRLHQTGEYAPEPARKRDRIRLPYTGR